MGNSAAKAEEGGQATGRDVNTIQDVNDVDQSSHAVEITFLSLHGMEMGIIGILISIAVGFLVKKILQRYFGCCLSQQSRSTFMQRRFGVQGAATTDPTPSTPHSAAPIALVSQQHEIEMHALRVESDRQQKNHAAEIALSRRQAQADAAIAAADATAEANRQAGHQQMAALNQAAMSFTERRSRPAIEYGDYDGNQHRSMQRAILQSLRAVATGPTQQQHVDPSAPPRSGLLDY